MQGHEVGGLGCHEVLALLDRFVAGHLDATELAQVQTHVRGCSHCARFGGAYARVVTALRVGAVDAADEAVFARVGASVEARLWGRE